MALDILQTLLMSCPTPCMVLSWAFSSLRPMTMSIGNGHLIDPRLPKAQDKTMQGVRHDINIICKMSSPMSKGILLGLPSSPNQYSLTNIPYLGTPRQRIFYSKPQAQAQSFDGLFGISYTTPYQPKTTEQLPQ